ncbi:MAG: hypothetical protein ACAI25_15190 [Planctomycetota bacterium]
MGLLDKVKGFFTKETMPDETRLLLAGVENVHELRRGLDEIVTRNEVELKEVEREIDKLEKIELAEKDKVKAGTLSPREKDNTLRYIKRLRTRMDSYQKRHKIHQENIDLHLSLLDRIDEMEAMELKAVKQEQIEEIAVDYEERVEKHKEIILAGEAAAGREPRAHDDSRDRKELDALEKEILSEGKDGEEPEAEQPRDELEDEDEDLEPEEKPVAEKPVAEKPVKEEAKRAPLKVEPEGEKKVNVPTTERRVELE